MTSVPHWDLPFRMDGNGHAVEVEQDTLEDVTNCVEAIIRTYVGQRLEHTEFGIVEPTFQKQPIDTDAIIDQVLAEEPRAHLLMQQAPDQFDLMIARATVMVSLSEEASI